VQETFDALVTAAFGRHLLVRTAAGQELKARPFGRGLSVVCGDRVRCRTDGGKHAGRAAPRSASAGGAQVGDAPAYGAQAGGTPAGSAETHVLEVLPRTSSLYRSNARGGPEPVVANLSLLMIVIAPTPVPDLFVVDRYLSAASSGAIPAVLVVNKRELGVTPELRAELDAFRAAGYDCAECSARSDEGISALLDLCSGKVATLVGQSGVGKSSLVHRLVPHANVEVGELVREEEGRHTTTASRLFDLPRGGHLIDSPGVRDFAPAIDMLDASHLGFVEVARLAPGCRFNDCRHMREPACAVRAAVESGAMSARRYESYRRLRRLHEELIQSRGPRSRKPT
jgi:ribosome biogenesis GTPase / thiamine phosphate phosphatase